MPVIFYLLVSGNFYGREVQRTAPEFTLQDVHTQPHSLSQHQGKFTFLYFGYLNCDDVCHNQVGVMFNVNHQTTNTDLDFIFITMDPSRDSNQMLDSYFNQLGKNFTALSAPTMQALQKVANQYQSAFFATGAVNNGKDYEIAHQGNIFLIDPKGDIRVVYRNQYLRYDKIIEDLDKLRQEFKKR